jgi:twinkle protein
MITASEISERLARQAEAVAQMLLPRGRREAREWVAGSIGGEEGKSLKVCIAGEKAGVWRDFAGDDGGDLLDLWAATKGISVADAIREAREYLGVATPMFAGSRPKSYRRPERPKATRPRDAVLDYLHARGMSDDTISAFRVAGSEDGTEIIFPFVRAGELLNIKYLKLERPDGKKQVRQEKDAEPCLFGWQAVPDRARSIVLCEGELDAMTWWQMGFPALSVWSGAGNLQWVENEWERLAQFDRIYVAFDNDDAGRSGAMATLERLGRARCRMVTTVHKDANECLMRGLDRDCFRDMIDAAQSMDPKELRSASLYRDAVLARFFPSADSPAHWVTPFRKLTDRGVAFNAGELVILNGINGHGKTKFLTQLALSLMQQGAKCCIASMEIKPDALLHSMTVQGCALRQPSEAFIRHVQEWWNGRLWMFDVVGTVKADYLLDVFRYARHCYGVTCFFIDSLAKCGLAEDDYNGQKRFVEALCDFKNETDSIVFLVTHSRKLDAETRVVDKMDIKGTGAIADLADAVTTVWRNKAKQNDPEGKAEECDARWYWQKNRNGDFEGAVQLWFDVQCFQFLEFSDSRPRAFVHFVRELEVGDGHALSA